MVKSAEPSPLSLRMREGTWTDSCGFPSQVWLEKGEKAPLKEEAEEEEEEEEAEEDEEETGCGAEVGLSFAEFRFIDEMRASNQPGLF